MNTVFLTDGYWRKTLAILKGLASKGIDVGIGERTILSTALFSKYAKQRYVYPSVTLKPIQFIGWLEELFKKKKFEVFITPEEETALLISKNILRLKSLIKIPIVDYEKLAFARDKFKLLSYALNINVLCPYFKKIESINDLKERGRLQYPLVLKPCLGTGSRGIVYVHSDKELEKYTISMLKTYKNFLLQEYIPGNEYYGVSVLFNKKNLLRSFFVHKKIRQYPITGGVSTYAISVYYPELVEIAEKLLSSIGWYGVANVEFKIDQRDGMPKLMEVNPRFWGSVDLAINSGVNFPYLLYKLAISDDIESVFDYKKGIKYRWMLPGDFRSFFDTLMKQHKIDWEFFKFYEKDIHYAILSLKDPLPVFGRMLSLIDYCFNK